MWNTDIEGSPHLVQWCKRLLNTQKVIGSSKLRMIIFMTGLKESTICIGCQGSVLRAAQSGADCLWQKVQRIIVEQCSSWEDLKKRKGATP